MKKITSIAELRASILLLETQQANEGQLLKEQFKDTYESLKPVNIIKSTFKELITAPDFKDNLMGATTSLAAGYFSKKIVIGSTHNPFKKAIGIFLQLGVSSFVSKNRDVIKQVAKNMINTFASKKDTPA